jgi:hypothetical protein
MLFFTFRVGWLTIKTAITVGIGDIILWTICECDLALIAGSLPMLRTLFKSIKGSIQQRSTQNTHNTELVSMGKPQKIREQTPSDLSSDREHIVITVDHHVDHESRAAVTPNSEMQPQYQAKSYF